MIEGAAKVVGSEDTAPASIANADTGAAVLGTAATPVADTGAETVERADPAATRIDPPSGRHRIYYAVGALGLAGAAAAMFVIFSGPRAGSDYSSSPNPPVTSSSPNPGSENPSSTTPLVPAATSAPAVVDRKVTITSSPSGP